MFISTRFPYLEVQFQVRSFQMCDWAYLDTGFDGFLVVPEIFGSLLGAPDLVSNWELGDGTLAPGADYLGEIELIGSGNKIRGQVTCLGDEWLLGLGVLNHFAVTFDHGQQVEVRP